MDYHENRGSPFAVRIQEDPKYQNSELPRNVDVHIPTGTTVHVLRDDGGVWNAPERALTIFAMRLAILERIATGVGTLSFIWATVVILGGYAVALRDDDFWFVTIILFIEGARIFSRSHELEWQRHDNMNLGETIFVTYQSLGHAFSSLVFSSVHEAMDAQQLQESMMTINGSNRNSASNSTPGYNYQNRKPERDEHHESSSISEEAVPAFRFRRAWSIPHAPFLPFMTTLFKAQYVSLYLYCLQVLSALVSFGLSLWRLIFHDFSRPDDVQDVGGKNHTAALFIFYSLTLFEVAVFLVEKAYWQYEMWAKRIMETTHQKCRLWEHDKELYTTKRFFYDVLQKCLNESVFEGLKMDMVGYALQWIHSDEQKEQLYGVKALHACAMMMKEKKKPDDQENAANENANANANGRRQVEETLRVIGRRQGAVERLMEMVSWRNFEERRVREAAAELVAKLVEYDVANVRVASTSGSMQAIFTLLKPPHETTTTLDDEFESKSQSEEEEEEEEEDDSPFSCCYLASSSTRSQASSSPTRTDPQQRRRLVLLGLDIFIHLARRRHNNCSKIGRTPRLLPTLLSLIDISPHPPSSTSINHDDNNNDRDDNTINPSGGATTTLELVVVEKSLQLLCHLASCHGIAGRKLREAILREVVSLVYLRRILQLEEEEDPEGGVMAARRRSTSRGAAGRLKLLAAEVVARLAMEEMGREAIGRTGGMMGSLMRLFVGRRGAAPKEESDEKVAAMAGNALARLLVVHVVVAGGGDDDHQGSSSTRSRRIRRRRMMMMMGREGGREGGGMVDDEDDHDHLVETLEALMEDPSKGKVALAILRSLLLWEEEEDQLHHHDNMNMNMMNMAEEDEEDHHPPPPPLLRIRSTTCRLATLLPRVLSLAMDPPNSSEAIMEEAIAFVATMLGSMTTETGRTHHWELGIAPNRVVEMIMSVLAKHMEPSTRVPRMRRSCLELVLALTTVDSATFVPLFREQGLVYHLRHISKSSSEMENFSTFHGHSGVSSHPITMQELITNVNERTRSL